MKCILKLTGLVTSTAAVISLAVNSILFLFLCDNHPALPILLLPVDRDNTITISAVQHNTGTYLSGIVIMYLFRYTVYAFNPYLGFVMYRAKILITPFIYFIRL